VRKEGGKKENGNKLEKHGDQKGGERSKRHNRGGKTSGGLSGSGRGRSENKIKKFS